MGHLHSRLDDRLSALAASSGETLHLFRTPGGIHVGRLTPSRLVVTGLDGQPIQTISFEPPLQTNGVARQTSAGLRIFDNFGGHSVGVRDENGKQLLRSISLIMAVKSVRMACVWLHSSTAMDETENWGCMMRLQDNVMHSSLLDQTQSHLQPSALIMPGSRPRVKTGRAVFGTPRPA